MLLDFYKESSITELHIVTMERSVSLAASKAEECIPSPARFRISNLYTCYKTDLLFIF